MKLLSLHINAYGKFSDYEYSFDNFNAFCEDNGYGKSTICSFIWLAPRLPQKDTTRGFSSL